VWVTAERRRRSIEDSRPTKELRIAVGKDNAGAAAGSGAIYAFGIFGAWVFYWQQADTFWEYLLAILQGIVWPAFMVYEAFSALAG
jgi:hypothetical protein